MPSHPSRPSNRFPRSGRPSRPTDQDNSSNSPSDVDGDTGQPSHHAPARPSTSPQPSLSSGLSGASVLRVVPLSEPSQSEPAKRGRKAKLEMPPLPQALLDGMTELERAHHQFFVDSIAQDYQIKKPSDYLALHMAALDYIQLLRVQALQMASGEVITAARQHPGVQLRAWLDSMSTTRRARKEQPSDEDEDLKRWKEGLRKISS